MVSCASGAHSPEASGVAQDPPQPVALELVAEPQPGADATAQPVLTAPRPGNYDPLAAWAAGGTGRT